MSFKAPSKNLTLRSVCFVQMLLLARLTLQLLTWGILYMKVCSSLRLVALTMRGASDGLKPLAVEIFASTSQSPHFIASVGDCCTRLEARPCMPTHVKEMEGQGLYSVLAHGVEH